jgi:hypothetical protein
MQKKRLSCRNKKNINIQETQLNCCEVMNVDDNDEDDEDEEEEKDDNNMQQQ